jgi:hypothetical protein
MAIMGAEPPVEVDPATMAFGRFPAYSSGSVVNSNG